MKRLSAFRDKLKLVWRRITAFFTKGNKRVLRFVDDRPYASFFAILGILFILIIISNVLGAPKVEEKKPTVSAKPVQTYIIGSAPKLTVQAQIEKSGVVRITALTPGVVQSIGKQVGEQVVRGEVLLNLASNYQGGNSSSLQRQLAQTGYQNAIDTYDLQKDIIKKQRDVAEKGDVQADELRNIADKSLADTKALVDVNGQILATLDQNLAELESTNTGGANDELILSTRQMKSQFLAANNQVKQASLSAQFNAASDKAPAELSNLQKDLALRQLDLQEKMLDVNREVSRIQLQIAQVAEAMMFPSAPFTGTVQRVNVKVGQQVNPGTELMVLSEVIEEDPVVAIAYVSGDIARKVSRLEKSVLHIGNTTVSAYPSYVTQDAISGSLYGVYFDIPDQYAGRVTEKGFVSVELPIGYADTAAAVPYIPVDAIYQTKDQNYVFVARGGQAEAKSVTLGNVFGSFVEIQKGLGDSDKVILDRNVIAGDKITTR